MLSPCAEGLLAKGILYAYAYCKAVVVGKPGTEVSESRESVSVGEICSPGSRLARGYNLPYLVRIW